MSWSSVQSSNATPTIGQSSSPRASSRYSEWKVITRARSPVIPKMTSTSARFRGFGCAHEPTSCASSCRRRARRRLVGSTLIRPGRSWVNPAHVQSTIAFARSSPVESSARWTAPQASAAILPFIVLPARHLHDRGAAADRRHRALVVVLERLRLLAGDEPGDVLAGALARLQRDRAELRQHLVRLRVGDPGDVADREHLRMAREAEVGPDRRSRFPRSSSTPSDCDERVRLQARAPHERVRLEHRRPT